MNTDYGTFYGVGVGPGDPELLTLRAHRLLGAVDVICYPACKPGASSYAFRVVKELIDPARQSVKGLVFPMSRDLSALKPIWRQSAGAIVEELRAGKSVAFITEGDPMLYSTFLHVYQVIAEEQPGIAVEIVPGVSSISAGAAAGRMAIAQGEQRIAIIPATYHAEQIRATLERFDTVVLMKVGSVFDRVLDVLEEMGLADKALLFSRVGARKGFVTREVRAWRGRPLGYLTTLMVVKDPNPSFEPEAGAEERE